MAYYRRGLTITEEINDQQGIVAILTGIGRVNMAIGQYDIATSYCTRAFSIAQEIGYPQGIRGATSALYEIYKATNNSSKALEMYELHVEAKDSIESEENQRELIRQEYKYEYEKMAIADSVAFAKQQELASLQLSRATSPN